MCAHSIHTYTYMNTHTYIFKTPAICQDRNRAKGKMDLVPTLMGAYVADAAYP